MDTGYSKPQQGKGQATVKPSQSDGTTIPHLIDKREARSL